MGPHAVAGGGKTQRADHGSTRGPEAGRARPTARLPGLPEVPAHAQGGQAQLLASLGIPVVLTLNGLVDRFVVPRHVLRIGAAPELLKDVQTSRFFAVRYHAAHARRALHVPSSAALVRCALEDRRTAATRPACWWETISLTQHQREDPHLSAALASAVCVGREASPCGEVLDNGDRPKPARALLRHRE